MQYRKVRRKLFIALSSPGLRVLCSTSRRIMIFDPDGVWQHAEARCGHGPHGASRRRARSSAGRVRGRREVAVMVDRERCSEKNAGHSGRGSKQDAYFYVGPNYGSAPDHTRPKAVDRVGTHINTNKQKSMRGDGEEGSKHQEKRDNRPLPNHLGGSCELRARFMRCFDGSEQQRHHRRTCGRALQRRRWHLPSGLSGRDLGSS